MSKLAALFKFILVSSILLCLLFLTYIHHENNTSLMIHRGVFETNNTKHILLWTGSKAFHLPKSEGDEIFDSCEYKNCYLTENRELLPVEEYAAILFSIPSRTDHPKEQPPKRRDPRQRYVFVNAETPIRFKNERTHYVFNDFYNWTMTYRFDSDIVRRHGYLLKQKTKYEMPSKEEVRNKKGSVAWIVSNCNSVNHRENLAKNLAKHIQVDVYGKCGTFKCPENGDCYDYVAKNYRFYLSFENSYCRDYTTEKLYKALERDIVPVVYGGGDYASVAPPRSFINVEHFDSAEVLASYLKILEQDVDTYLEYFEWKRDYVVVKRSQFPMCEMCERLNDPEEPPKIYEDIKGWWWSDQICRQGKHLPQIALEDV